MRPESCRESCYSPPDGRLWSRSPRNALVNISPRPVPNSPLESESSSLESSGWGRKVEGRSAAWQSATAAGLCVRSVEETTCRSQKSPRSHNTRDSLTLPFCCCRPGTQMQCLLASRCPTIHRYNLCGTSRCPEPHQPNSRTCHWMCPTSF